MQFIGVVIDEAFGPATPSAAILGGLRGYLRGRITLRRALDSGAA